MVDFDQQLDRDLDVLLKWIEGRNALLNRVLFLSTGACEDLCSNSDLLELGERNRLIRQTANELALGIRWIRKGRDDTKDLETGDPTEPLAQAAEEYAGSAVDWQSPNISEREQHRRYKAHWKKKRVSTAVRIASAIRASRLSDTEPLEHLAAAHQALCKSDPEKAVYELGSASRSLWRASNFGEIRRTNPAYSSLWMEGEVEHWEKHVACQSTFESLQSHKPELPFGVRVTDGERGFFVWPVVTLLIGLAWGYWLGC